jgi:hypothetical protein
MTSLVPQSQIERAFDLERQLRNVDNIFARVFHESAPKHRSKARGTESRRNQ